VPNDGGTFVPTPGTEIGIDIPADAIKVLGS
jgi:hypothetical protein